MAYGKSQIANGKWQMANGIWIALRMTGQETRNKLTDCWAGHDIKAGQEFAILTSIIHTNNWRAEPASR